jgi:3-(3-hydroxy-phenyl)propionate hydroxylase
MGVAPNGGEMTSEYDYDVLISGYGPAGQAAASLLARLGHRVCVFEKFPTLYGQPRLCTIDGETARIVQQAGDVNHAFRESSWCRRYDLYDGDDNLMMTVDWSGLHICGYPGRISFFQPDVEDAMDAAARERGAAVNQGWEVQEIHQDADGVEVKARQRDLGYGRHGGEDRSVRAKYLIGADGARSFTREAVGITRTDYGFRDAFLSIDCEKLRPLHRKFDVAFSISAPGRTIAYIPIGRNRMRCEFLVNPDDDHTELLVPEIGYDFINQAYGLNQEDVRIYRQVIYPFEGKVANDWRKDRVFIVGDAAHLMPPFLGQGACSALRDSINLAWKLDLVLRGRAPDALLDTYELERSPHVSVLVEGSVLVGQVACERDPGKAAARDEMFRSGNVPPPPDQPQLLAGILHRDGGGAIVAPSAELMEQGIGVYRGQTGRFDDLVGWGFHLIAWEADPLAGLTGEQCGFLERIGVKAVRTTSDPSLDAWLDIDRTYESWFTDRNMLKAVLVRPDFTVFGGVWSMDDLPALVDDLRNQLSAEVLETA